MAYLYLALAIVAEVIATSALKASAGFTRLGPTLLVASGYTLAFYCLTEVLRYLPLGVTYAIWSGLGIVLITLVGIVAFQQIPDWPAIIGMALIVSGVTIMHLFSDTVHY